jgi:hypothetical protein
MEERLDERDGDRLRLEVIADKAGLHDCVDLNRNRNASTKSTNGTTSSFEFLNNVMSPSLLEVHYTQYGQPYYRYIGSNRQENVQAFIYNFDRPMNL